MANITLNNTSPARMLGASLLALVIVAALALVARHTGAPVEALAAAFVRVLGAILSPRA